MKLGQITTDTITGAKVTPTSLLILNKENTNRRVCVTIKGINKETGLPFAQLWFVENRLKDGLIENEAPSELIGEYCECMDTGLKGVIGAIRVDYNGCIHAEVIPNKLLPSGDMANIVDIDIRRLKGKNMPKLNNEQLEVSRKTNPSPNRVEFCR